VSDTTPVLIAFVAVVAGVISAAISPLIHVLAVRFGLVDRPDGYRKLHVKPVALGGGVSIFCAVLVATCLMLLLEPSLQELWRSAWSNNIGIFVASGLIVALGLVDDRFGLRGRHKLLGQIAIAIVLTNCGYVIPGVTLFGIQFGFGLMSYPITLVWLLLAINALNLIDGIDGLASIVGLIQCITMACLAWLNNHHAATFLLATMGGAIAGFLPFNFPPARMFLGDAGSMLIGMWIGAVSILGSLKGPAVIGLTAPLAVWTVPLLDTFAAILRRKLTGRSIYTTDRCHLHHCLQQVAGSTRRALYFVVLACTATCFGALTTVWLKSDLVALLSMLSVVAVLVATHSFGYGELKLLATKAHTAVSSLNPLHRVNRFRPQQHAIRFQGSQPWEVLWTSLLPFRDEFNLTRLNLDVNVPSCHESYHVSWTTPEDVERCPRWETKIPLCVGEQIVGQLLISGLHDRFSVVGRLAKLMEALQSFETQFQDAIGRNIREFDEHALSAPKAGGNDLDPAKLPPLTAMTP
jgi:UDP-GlcNAc:undecaprenyl-phosphate GlcNAc-1-phosphate transferase